MIAHQLGGEREWARPGGYPTLLMTVAANTPYRSPMTDNRFHQACSMYMAGRSIKRNLDT